MRNPGEAYLQYLPEHPDLLDELFQYAEESLYMEDDKKKKLKTYINDNNELWEQTAQQRGYQNWKNTLIMMQSSL